MMAKTFAASQIREMHFDGGNSDGGDRIAQRHTCVGISPSIDDQRIDAPYGLLYSLDEAPFMVGLQDFKLHMMLSSKLLQAAVDFLKGYETINLRFAVTE